jgi:hypothetical protein
MRTSAPCPACGAAVTAHRLAWAPTPWSFRCRSCGARVGLRGRWVLLEVALAVAFTVVVVVVRRAYLRHVPRFANVAALVGITIPVDYAFSIAVLSRGGLERNGRDAA